MIRIVSTKTGEIAEVNSLYKVREVIEGFIENLGDTPDSIKISFVDHNQSMQLDDLANILA